MSSWRRDVRLAVLVALVAVVALAVGRLLLGGSSDGFADCERAVSSARGGTEADVERVCGRLR